MRFFQITLFCVLIVSMVFSSVVFAKPLTLKDAIDQALQNNSKYQISVEQVRESRYRVREAWGMLWPQLSTDVAYTRQWAESGFNASIEAVYTISFINAELYVNPGAFYHTLQASRKGHIIAVNNVRTVSAETTIKTIQLYYQIILSGETVKMRRESLKALEENLKTVTIGYRKGILSKLDYLRAKVAWQNETTLLINAENDSLTARAFLNIHIGADINDSLEIDTSGMMKVDESGMPVQSDAEQERKALETMVALSLKNRPELIQITSRKEAEEHGASAAQSVYLWPTFFMLGKYGTTKNVMKPGEMTSTGNPMLDQMLAGMRESFAPPEWNDSWSITFGATYRWGALCPLDSSHAKSDQARSRAKQARYQLDDFIKTVRLEVQSGFLKLKSALNSLKSQEGNIQTAEESMRVSIVQFRNGIIDNTKLLEANVQLTTARTLYIQALYNYQVAKAELNRAIGVDYFTIE